MSTPSPSKTTRSARKAALPAKAPKRAVPATKAKRRPVVAAVPTGSKQSQLVAMLRSPTGATIEQMTGATGWQAHSVRGVISGVLRKRLNLNVTCARDPDGGARIYRVVEAA